MPLNRMRLNENKKHIAEPPPTEAQYASRNLTSYFREDKEIQEAVAGDEEEEPQAEEDERAVCRRTRGPRYCMVYLVISRMRFTLHKWQISCLREDIQRIHALLHRKLDKFMTHGNCWLGGPLATARAGAIFTGRLATVVADEVGRIY